ncbi:MAG: allantoinase AllB [Lachnospiraceae bacterium]|nr:allantoinase AllB [Lachnospiraceae bacterium]
MTESNEYKADVYIKEGKISLISNGEILSAKKTINAKGMLLFPGLIDTHMHIGEYSADYEEMDTATLAAAAGGFTCLIDMPVNQQSPSIKTKALFAEKKGRLEENAYTDFCMWGALCPDNINEYRGMRDEGAVAFKAFLSGGGNDFPAPDMAELRDALAELGRFGGMAGFHCEDNSIIQHELQKMKKYNCNSRRAFLDSRPLIAEMLATKNVIELAKEAGARVHICHVSHPKVAQLIKDAKADGVDISAETCVHYLVFNEENLINSGCLFKCAPPLRTKEDSERLWDYVLDGTFSSIASDHSPGMPDNRDDTIKPIYEVGNGISGVQTMLQTFYNAIIARGISPTIIAKLMSTEPAKRFGIYGKKGDIKVGFDGDIVIFNPDREWTITSDELFYKQKISAYVGISGVGKPVKTILRGEEIVGDGIVYANKGVGKFVSDKEAG